jgi:hypothetical protein
MSGLDDGDEGVGRDEFMFGMPDRKDRARRGSNDALRDAGRAILA